MSQEYKNILIVRTDRIGDVVLSLPLIEIIKKRYPKSKVSFLIREYTFDLLKHNSKLNKLLILEEERDKPQFISNIKKIKKYQFDTCIIVSPTFKMALILFFSGIHNRIGTGYRWYSFLFNKKIYEHRKNGTKHELEHNVSMLKTIGIDESISPSTIKFGLQHSNESLIKVKEYLKQQNLDVTKPNIIIHPGSLGSAIDLPIQKLIELVELLLQESKVNIIISGSKKEKHICDKLALSPKVINAAGVFNIENLISLISLSNILVANSTGPIHIAAAMEIGVVGFYPM
ncbi:MAG: glycosyltransferase family 9 protein, partial [Melioribacteraceae bacterium]